MSLIKSQRNVDDLNVQKCRVGTGDDDKIREMYSAVQARIFSAVKSNGGQTRRRKRTSIIIIIILLKILNN